MSETTEAPLSEANPPFVPLSLSTILFSLLLSLGISSSLSSSLLHKKETEALAREINKDGQDMRATLDAQGESRRKSPSLSVDKLKKLQTSSRLSSLGCSLNSCTTAHAELACIASICTPHVISLSLFFCVFKSGG